MNDHDAKLIEIEAYDHWVLQRRAGVAEPNLDPWLDRLPSDRRELFLAHLRTTAALQEFGRSTRKRVAEALPQEQPETPKIVEKRK